MSVAAVVYDWRMALMERRARRGLCVVAGCRRRVQAPAITCGSILCFPTEALLSPGEAGLLRAVRAEVQLARSRHWRHWLRRMVVGSMTVAAFGVLVYPMLRWIAVGR